MFADLPFQGTLDLDAIFSRFDDETNPPNVTTWEASSVDVVFKAATPPKNLKATNSKVAGGSFMPRALFQNRFLP